MALLNFPGAPCAASASPSQPATRGFAITPADADLAQTTRGLFVGTAGTLVVILAGDTAAITLNNAPAGYHPLACRRVCAATAASQIVGLY